MRSTQDAVLATHAEVWQRGATKNVGLWGEGAGGQRQGSHAGKPGRVGRGWRVQDASVSAGQRKMGAQGQRNGERRLISTA